MRLLFLISLLAVLFCNVASAQTQNSFATDTSTTSLKPLAKDTWISKDKADHMIASAFLTGAQYYLAHRELERSHEQSLSVAIGATMAIGLAKEIYDQVSRKGTPSVKDVVADALGIGVAAVLLRR